MNKKKIWIIGGGIFFGIVLLGIILFMINSRFKVKNIKTNVIDSFHYYSGSSGYAIEFVGKREGKEVNIYFKEYDSGEQKTENYIISFEYLQQILNKTKQEDCSKQSYEYQCEENSGCSYSSFSITYLKDSTQHVCYENTYEIYSFFKNFHTLYSEIDDSALSLEEKNEIDIVSLLEDIKSIKTNERINHPQIKTTDLEKVIYQGNGYVIEVIEHDDKTDYFIYCNQHQIWKLENNKIS